MSYLDEEKSVSRTAGFMAGFRHGLGHTEIERQRLAELSKPFKGNPPELFTPTRCKVLKAFGLGAGGVAVPGTTIELPRHEAQSMQGIGKVEIL